MFSGRILYLAALSAAFMIQLGGTLQLRAQGGDRFVTLELEKTGPTRCRVVQSWTSKDGSMCMQLQAVGSGARMTVVQVTQGGQAGDVHVYSWGTSTSSPPGVPLPPSAIQQTRAATPPRQLPAASGDEIQSAPVAGRNDRAPGMKGAAAMPEVTMPKPHASAMPVREVREPALPALPDLPIQAAVPVVPLEPAPEIQPRPNPRASVPVEIPQQLQLPAVNTATAVYQMVPGQPNSIAITVTLPPNAMAQAMRQQAISALQESGGSAQRELAVRDLAGRDHADNPQVIQALMQAMANDPSANVRLSAARSLGRMVTKGDEVIAALVRQRTDSDARVRSEVDRAIVLILSGQEK